MKHVTSCVGVLPQASSQLALGMKFLPLEVSRHCAVHVVQCCTGVAPFFEPIDVCVEPLLDVACSNVEVV